MKTKKLVALVLVAVLAITSVVGTTLAYFTDSKEATNTFTVGDVKIELTETLWDAEEKDDVYPGEPLAKNPVVTNKGSNPCFVRIEVTGWDCLDPAGDITYRTDYVDGKLGDNWVIGGDGYFYYTEVLEADKFTDALFDQIVIRTDLTNGYDASYSLVVKAEAVQAQGTRPSFAAVKEMTVPEIAGWFATCGM